MQIYLDLLQDVQKHGERRSTRTGKDCLSVFGRQLRVPLAEGFPALTTKKLHMRSIVHELLWFIRGETHTKYLHDNGVQIWDPWIDKDGEVGPLYGVQWRKWKTERDKTIDQLAEVVSCIQRDPFSRRLVVSAWNVGQLSAMVLPPCHVLFQFYVSKDKRLSCQLYQRSADLFIGVPFNIASYALLTHMIAKLCGLGVGDFVHSFGDVHLYVDHLCQVEEQLKRRPKPLPSLEIRGTQKSIDDFCYEDIVLKNYEAHPHIKADVAV